MKAKSIQIRRLVTVKRILIIAIAGSVALVAGLALAMGASRGASAASKSGAVSVKQFSGNGSILANSKGFALYTNNLDKKGKPVCNGACLSFWKPVTAGKAPKISSLPGKFALINRGGGLKQVTYKGKPLYTFAVDKKGQVTGDGAHDAFGGHQFTWHVVHAGKASSPATTGTTSSTNPYGY